MSTEMITLSSESKEIILSLLKVERQKLGVEVSSMYRMRRWADVPHMVERHKRLMDRMEALSAAIYEVEC